MNKFSYTALIEPVVDHGGAFVSFPYDIKELFHKGRVKANVLFDNTPYSGSIVNMGIKNQNGSICYIIGIRKDIKKNINKFPGDYVDVVVTVEKN